MRQTLISPLVAGLEDNPETDSLELTTRGGVIPTSGIYPLTLCLNQQQTTQLLSAAWNGALLTYPDNPLQVLQPLLQALEDIGGFASCLGENMLYRINDNCLFQSSVDGENWTTLKDIANDCADFPILVTRVGGDGQTELRYYFRSEPESAANAIDRLLLAVWPTEFRVITESGISRLQRRNRGFSDAWGDVLNLPRLSSQSQTVQHYPFGVGSLNVESGRILRFENGAGLVTVLPVSYISDVRIRRDGLSYDFDVQYNNLNDWRPYGSFGLPGYGLAVNSEQCRLEFQADGQPISHIDIADLAKCLPDPEEGDSGDIGLTNANRCFAVKELMLDLERAFQDVINAYQADRVNEDRRQLIDDIEGVIGPFLRGKAKAAKVVGGYLLDQFKVFTDDLDDDDLLELEASLTLGKRQAIERALYCQSVANGNYRFNQAMTNVIGNAAESENYGEIEGFDGFELFAKDAIGTANLASLWSFYIQRGQSNLCTSFECETEWQRIFEGNDLSTFWGLFNPSIDYAGAFATDQWNSVSYDFGSYSSFRLSLQSVTFPSTFIREVRISFGPGTNQGGYQQWYVDNQDWAFDASRYQPYGNGSTASWLLEKNATRIRFDMAAALSGDTPQFIRPITRIVLIGTGSDPF